MQSQNLVLAAEKNEVEEQKQVVQEEKKAVEKELRSKLLEYARGHAGECGGGEGDGRTFDLDRSLSEGPGGGGEDALEQGREARGPGTPSSAHRSLSAGSLVSVDDRSLFELV